MFSRRIQQRAKQLVAFLMRPLADTGVTPNMLTVIGLLLSGITALVIAQGHLFVGGLLIPFAGILTCLMGQWHRFKTQLQALAHF